MRLKEKNTIRKKFLQIFRRSLFIKHQLLFELKINKHKDDYNN